MDAQMDAGKQMDTEKQMDTSSQVETMIIQAIRLVDSLDKEVNTYAMKARELYGRHFPELDRILQDNILYAKSVKLMGDRVNASNIDFSQILSDEVEAELKKAALISIGTVVSDLDLKNIMDQCDQVLSLSECRAHLSDYLKSRMNTFAPNLTTMVGELVGARLIARKGSLLNLAKQPGSTIQILDAEETLSKALETNQPIPRHRLIYCAPLVDQSSQPKTKGRFCRSLAAKTALAVRYDAFRRGPDNRIGLENLAKLEARLTDLKDRETRELSKSIEPKITSTKRYNPAADSTLEQAIKDAWSCCLDYCRIRAAATGNEETYTKKKKKKSSETEEQTPAVEEKKEKKKKKKKSDEDGEGETAKKEKKKKKDKEEKVVEDLEKNKKKKMKHKDVEEEAAEQTLSKKKDKTKMKKTDKEEKVVEDGEKSKRKKKRKHADVEEEAAEQAQSKKKEKKKKKSEE